MAATPEPQPDHPLVKNLDKVFTGKGGNAPALVGWLSYLAHPEEHGGDAAAQSFCCNRQFLRVARRLPVKA